MDQRIGEEFQKGTAYNALEKHHAARRGATEGGIEGKMEGDIGGRMEGDTSKKTEGDISGIMEGDIGGRHIREADGEIIGLPEPVTRDGAPLWKTISSRRSVRKYGETPLTIEELSRLLWAMQGITAIDHGFDYRAAPSAGALYPVDTYVVVNKVEGMDRGIYLYEPGEHGLRVVKRGDFCERAREAALGQSMASGAPVFFIWTAVFARGMWKYGQRAFRYFYLDAGHIAGNLSLAAVALGLGSCQVGAFFDDLANRLVGADGERETVIYMTSVGRPAGQ